MSYDPTDLDLHDRKVRKPLVERKRRQRINRSLDELLEFLTEVDFIRNKGTKLEKADILEMTVQYLRQTKRQPDDTRENKENMENVLMERYLMGFEKCAHEAETVVEPRLRYRLHCHLRDCLEKVKTQQQQQRKGEETDGVRSVLIQEPKDLKILPSKLPNGDVLLLLSSSNCEERMNAVWRPWW